MGEEQSFRSRVLVALPSTILILHLMYSSLIFCIQVLVGVQTFLFVNLISVKCFIHLEFVESSLHFFVNQDILKFEVQKFDICAGFCNARDSIGTLSRYRGFVFSVAASWFLWFSFLSSLFS